jgi:hypothetical protein
VLPAGVRRHDFLTRRVQHAHAGTRNDAADAGRATSGVREHGGFGVMLDDVLAGVYALIALQLMAMLLRYTVAA